LETQLSLTSATPNGTSAALSAVRSPQTKSPSA
jgi:hypothetical protein